MDFFEFFGKMLKSRSNDKFEPMLVMEVLERDQQLTKRLQGSGVLAKTEVAGCLRTVMSPLPCSWEVWESFNEYQRTDILNTGIRTFTKLEGDDKICVHLKEIFHQGKSTVNELTAAITDPTVSKVLIGDRFLPFHEYVAKYANINYTVDFDPASGLEVKMSAVE